MNAVLLEWPGDEDRVHALRAEGAPRLLLVEPGAVPPTPVDCLEDWVACPAEEQELRHRIEALESRAAHHATRPSLDEHGVLRFRGAWIDLTPVEAVLTTGLLERFGAVVPRDSLMRRAWPDDPGPERRNLLDVHLSRTRRRIAPLGLRVRTVRGRGYLLEAEADDHLSTTR